MTQQTGENGSLCVTIVEARQLKDRDLIDDDDPYVELYLDKQTKRRTSTVQESNNPIWNETFTLFVRISSSKYLLIDEVVFYYSFHLKSIEQTSRSFTYSCL